MFYLLRRKAAVLLVAVAFSSLQVFFALPPNASAATQSPGPAAKISFTFDDGYASAATQAAPTLAKYGYTGTDYVITGCVGMTKAPNTCRANTDATYMSWSQVLQLKNTYGWEIGSHTVTHPYLATSDASDGQPNVLTQQQVISELSQSKAALAAQGINATAFATPYGDYNNQTLATIAKYYTSQRGFGDVGLNSWPYSDYFLRVEQVQNPVSVATVQGYINSAVANNQWLILVFHNIKTRASNNADDYEYSTSNLSSIANYAKTKGLPGVNISAGLTASDANLLTNGSFNAGLSGWSTDNINAIVPDSGSNGSYPDSTYSAKLISSIRANHLFSSRIQIDPNATYLLKNYLSVTQNSGGEVGFYIDEYDGFGNWISGQYKGAEHSAFTESLNFSYKASSQNVAKARLQVYVTATVAAGGIVAYLDNAQWFPLTSVSPPPPVVQVSLLPNYNFDAGISAGWRTDSPATITADALSNGSPANIINSIKIVGSATNTHLFSPAINIDPTKTYSLSNYVSIKQITNGEIGFYIDEYSSSGQWISGQYKTGVRNLGSGNVSFNYTPSSATVAKASLQVIQTANSNVVAYVDNTIWLQN